MGGLVLQGIDSDDDDAQMEGTHPEFFSCKKKSSFRRKVSQVIRIKCAQVKCIDCPTAQPLGPRADRLE